LQLADLGSEGRSVKEASVSVADGALWETVTVQLKDGLVGSLERLAGSVGASDSR
jgi:hypothetical protein